MDNGQAACIIVSETHWLSIRQRKLLTPRELQVLRCVVSTIDKFDTLAASLNMSVDTFDTHWREVRRKMDIPTYTGQGHQAQRCGVALSAVCHSDQVQQRHYGSGED
jgi:DNA-binding CsgD family transcriptional regulator